MGRVLAWMEKFGRHVLDVLFPLECVACGMEGTHACRRCLAHVRRSDVRIDGRTAAPCVEVLAAYAYADPLVRTLLGDWKYRGWAAASGGLETLVRRWAATHEGWLRGAVLVPVPLHPRRLRQRGFNQAEAIAGWLASACGLEVRTDLLTRVRATPPQARLDASERLRHMPGAFSAHLPPALSRARLMLVDDVWTTGSTMRECAGALAEAGAAGVKGLALAWGRLGLDKIAEIC